MLYSVFGADRKWQNREGKMKALSCLCLILHSTRNSKFPTGKAVRFEITCQKIRAPSTAWRIGDFQLPDTHQWDPFPFSVTISTELTILWSFCSLVLFALFTLVCKQQSWKSSQLSVFRGQFCASWKDMILRTVNCSLGNLYRTLCEKIAGKWNSLDSPCLHIFFWVTRSAGDPLHHLKFLQRILHFQLNSCFSIYPSPDQDTGGGNPGIPINTGNTGSLPDLSNLHFPAPLTTPLDASGSATSGPTENHDQYMTPTQPGNALASDCFCV